MIKKSLAAIAAAMGLLTVPVAAVAPTASPTHARDANPSPVSKTDARHTRYYVPKGVAKRRRSRTSEATRACFGPPAGCNSNRFARRSMTKALMRGAGRLVDGFPLEARTAYGVQGRKPTTRRALARMKHVWAYRDMLKAHVALGCVKPHVEVES